jgi:putative phosphoribosyl transferase
MTRLVRFADREDAGTALASQLMRFEHRPDVVVLGLPRGGVVVAAKVADGLGLPLGVVVARKLGTPGRPELAMGALAVWGTHERVTRNADVVRLRLVSDAEFDAARLRELEVARRRAAEWGRPALAIEGRTVILVDDGLATGATLRAAVDVLRAAGAERIVVALPVAPAAELARVHVLVDEVECVHSPDSFGSVGAHYDDFAQVDDETVRDLLAAAAARRVG